MYNMFYALFVCSSPCWGIRCVGWGNPKVLAHHMLVQAFTFGSSKLQVSAIVCFIFGRLTMPSHAT